MYKNCFVDVSYIGSRIFYAAQSSNNNNLDNLVFIRFFNSIKRIKKEFGIQRFIYAFDSSNNFRKQLYPDYKANRDEKHPDLAAALINIEDFLKNGMRSYTFKYDGFEADDVIASSLSQFCSKDTNLIVSGDKDLLQLLNDKTHSIIGVGEARHDLVTPNDVIEKYGIEPKHISLYLALLGDSADNFNGIKGIGPKSAVKLIKQYGTYENIINNIDSDKIAKNVSDMPDPFLPYNLAKLRYDIPIEFARNKPSQEVVKKYQQKIKP